MSFRPSGNARFPVPALKIFGRRLKIEDIEIVAQDDVFVSRDKED
jgi:hypothetical protein